MSVSESDLVYIDPDLNKYGSVKYPTMSESKFSWATAAAAGGGGEENETLVIEQVETWVRRREQLTGIQSRRNSTHVNANDKLAIPNCCSVNAPQCLDTMPTWILTLMGTTRPENGQTRNTISPEMQKKLDTIDRNLKELLRILDDWLVAANKSVVHQHGECLRLLRDYEKDVSRTERWTKFVDFLARNLKSGVYTPSVPLSRGPTVENSDSDVDSVLDEEQT